MTRSILQLTKPRISIASTLTAALGYSMARGQFDFNILPVLIGGFLLASASAALNQIQERKIDSQVKRTVNRPLPAGKISLTTAMIIAAILFFGGFLALFLCYGWRVAGLGIFAAIIYNVIYTPLKRISAFAIFPGALVGAIPPLVGWLAAEGHLIDPRIYYVCIFFFIWQIPHFWLLLLIYSEQYKQNNLPSLFDKFSTNQIKRITYVGILVTAITGMLLPYNLLIKYQLVNVLILVMGIFLIVRTSLLFKQISTKDLNRAYRQRFVGINIFALIVTLLLILEHVT